MADPIQMAAATAPHVRNHREAFELVRDEILAVSRDDLETVLVDIPTTVANIHGIQDKLQSLRPQIAQLPFYDMRKHDNLLYYTMAMGKTNSDHIVALQNAQSLPVRHERAVALRQTLLTDVMALVQRGYIKPNRLEGLKGPVGYKNAATDLDALASLLRENLPLYLSKSAITEEDVAQAELLAAENLAAVGERDHESALAETALVRQQAYTLFIRTYEQVRRAVAYVRFDHKDAEVYAPSPFLRSPQAKKHEDDASGEIPITPVAPSPVAPVASPPVALGDQFGR